MASPPIATLNAVREVKPIGSGREIPANTYRFLQEYSIELRFFISSNTFVLNEKFLSRFELRYFVHPENVDSIHV